MYIAIGIGICLVIFAVVKAIGLEPTRQLFNFLLSGMTLGCLVSLVRLWPTHPQTAGIAAFMLVAATVRLLLDDDGKPQFAVLLPYAAIAFLVNNALTR